MAIGKANEDASSEKKKQTRVSQSDVPAYSLDEALRVSAAIFENYAGQPATPLNVATAMGLTPTSSHFRQLTGASIAFGLTEGGYNAPLISITGLAKRIHAPLEEGQDLAAKIEAFLRPRVISDFMAKYNGHAIPKQPIAGNVLADMGVPRDRTDGTLEMIMAGAAPLGLITEIKGKAYANLSGAKLGSGVASPGAVEEHGFGDGAEVMNEVVSASAGVADGSTASPLSKKIDLAFEEKKENRRVFITHGKNRAFVDPIKKLLSFGEMEAVVSVENQSVSQPVPDKVMEDMRSCGAAIIHVDGDQVLLDKEAKEQVVLNANVLIEIGAAIALYGRRFILLVKNGVTLPSNLLGLYEVRYDGDALDGDATIRLLEAINKLKAAKGV
jgi:predicted nucleotide-binding protein